MPVFAYTKLNEGGERAQGTIEAPTAADARRKLRESGVHIIEITNELTGTQKHPGHTSRHIGFYRIRQSDLSSATWQLAALLHAGIPLVPALSALVEQLANQPLATIFRQIRDRVNEGNSLADSIADYPTVFSQIYISMVSAGEAAGTLENILSRLAEMSEKRNNLSNKVKAAMVYPLFMAAVGVGVIVFIFTFILPGISKIFLEMNRRLPWPTVMLLKISGFIQVYLWLILIVLGLLSTVLILLFRTAAGRKLWDKFVLKCPLFGSLILKISIARFSRTLAVLLKSGLAIVEALELSSRVIGNTVVSNVIEDAKDAISRGQGIAQSLRKKGVFPPIVLHMIAAGEQSGGIEEGLENVADVFDNEVESAIKALTSLLEPVLIIVLGIVVGFIVLSILLPIFDINRMIA
jgi:general secretion pathway protein F